MNFLKLFSIILTIVLLPVNLTAQDRVGIGTDTPQEKLDVNGNINLSEGSVYKIGESTVLSTEGVTNLFAGINAGLSNIGIANTFVGTSAGLSNTGGNQNTFLGSGAGLNNLNGEGNTFLGRFAGRHNTGGFQNTFVGQFAGLNSTASGNTFMGASAGEANETGASNTFIGKSAGAANIGAHSNTFVGALSGELNTSGQGNSFFGEEAGNKNEGGSNNTFMGYLSGFYNTGGGNNTFIGSFAGAPELSTVSNATAIGSGAQVECSNCLVLGSTDGNGVNVGIGTSMPTEKLHLTGGLLLGNTSNTNDGTIRWTGSDFEGRTSQGWQSLTGGGMLSNAQGLCRLMGTAPSFY